MAQKPRNTFRHMGKTCACFNLRKAARSITKLYDEALRPAGLRATQFSLLAGTRVLEPVSFSRLARATAMDRTTLSRNIRILEKHGFVEIERGTDRRTRTVRLTPTGQRVLEHAIPCWERAQRRVVEHFGNDRFHALLSDLSRLVKIARGAVTGESP